MEDQAMQREMQRFTDRFQPLFAEKGLENIKFFVHDADGCSLSQFMTEAVAIQDTIVAGETSVIDNVDAGCRKKRFDEAF
jgi:hypothetical protein